MGLQKLYKVSEFEYQDHVGKPTKYDCGDVSLQDLRPAEMYYRKSPRNRRIGGKYLAGEEIEVFWQKGQAWCDAYYRGPDEKRRDGFVAVEYADRKGEVIGVKLTSTRKK